MMQLLERSVSVANGGSQSAENGCYEKRSSS